MPTTLFVAPPASGKTHHAVQRILQAAREAPPGAIWAILASGFQVRQFRQRLAQAGGTFGVQIATFGGFYHAILDQAGASLPLISQPVGFRLISQAVSQASLQGRLPYYDPIKEKPGFINLLSERFAELKRALVMPEDFVAQTVSETPAVRELAYLYQAYQDKLHQIGWADSEGLSWLAVEAMQNQPSLVKNISLVVVDGFTDFNASQLRALSFLAKSIHELWISLPGETGNQKISNQRFQKSLEEIQEAFQAGSEHQPVPFSLESPDIHNRNVFRHRMQGSLQFLSDHLFDQNPPLEKPGHISRSTPDDSLAMIESPSPEEEARESLRWLKALILRKDISHQECAIFIPNPDVYLTPLLKTAQEFKLPVHPTIGSRLRQTPSATALDTFLQLPLGNNPWRENFPRRYLLDCLRSPFFDLSLWDLHPSDAGKIEAISQQFRILAGQQSWLDALAILVKRASDMENVEPVEDGLNSPPALPGPAEATRLLDAFSRWFERLSPPASNSLSDWVSWLETLLIETRFLTLCGPIEAQAYKNTFVALAISEDLTQQADFTYLEFLKELFSVLETVEVKIATPKSGGIFIGRLLEGRGLRFKAVVLMGLSEGIFPEVEKPDPFLEEPLRQRFRLEPRLGRFQASLFHQAITRADRFLLLTRPYLAEGGEAWVPSYYWHAVCQLFTLADTTPPQVRIRGDALHDISNAASHPEVLFYATRQGLRTLPSPELMEDASLLEYSRMVLAARLAEKAAGPYEGYPTELGGLTAEFSNPGYTWSASSLETYSSCPFRYYVQRSLQCSPKIPPQPGLDAAQVGSIYHEILQHAFQSAENPADPVSVLKALHTLAGEIFSQAPGRHEFTPDGLWEQQQVDMLARLEQTILALFEESAGWQPLAYEQQYGYGNSPALELQTEAGRIRLHGFIDRLDRDEQGRLRVIDYKTGSSGMDKKDLVEGKRLQLPLYALAARQALGFGEVIDGFYWSINASKACLKLARFEEGDFSGLEGATAIAKNHVNRIVNSIHQAVFPPLPPAEGCPEYCPAALWCWRYSPSRW